MEVERSVCLIYCRYLSDAGSFVGVAFVFFVLYDDL